MSMQPESQPLTPGGARDLRVLIVEDHDFQRWSLRSMLGSLGVHRVIEAADGRAALHVLGNLGEPVDVVISDLDMPGMDGMELVRRVADAASSISMILVSALDRSVIATAESMAQAYGVHVLGGIHKPVRKEQLAQLLQRRLASPAERPTGAVTPAFAADDIMRALVNGEFEPFFQPIVEVASGRIRAAEALARWRHPDRGLVPPSAFIGALEDGGLIERLTLVILGKALDACAVWRSKGLVAGVSVNLSPRVLADVTFAEKAERLVRGRGIEPRAVVFEVTESTGFSSGGMTLENLARLRLMGFRLAIDDYGTGYSSIERLGQIAFTEMKVDRSFVGAALRQKSGRVILEHILEMARRLGLAATAEGVETREELQMLASLGCELAQGYFIAPPMPVKEFLEWARTR